MSDIESTLLFACLVALVILGAFTWWTVSDIRHELRYLGACLLDHQEEMRRRIDRSPARYAGSGTPEDPYALMESNSSGCLQLVSGAWAHSVICDNDCAGSTQHDNNPA